MNRPEDTSRLIGSCQGLVRSIAWKIHHRVSRHVELDDLIGYGQVGLAEAARDFDPTRGAQFTTFAYYRIRGAILDGLSAMSWFNRADYMRGRYERFANDVLGADKTESENLAEDARWLRQATGSLAVVYLMSQRSPSATSDSEPDYPGSDEPQPDASAEFSDLSAKLNRLLEELSEDARELVYGVYFEGLTLKEAGERSGISKAWASRLHSRALEKLAFGLTEYNCE